MHPKNLYPTNPIPNTYQIYSYDEGMYNIYGYEEYNFTELEDAIERVVSLTREGMAVDLVIISPEGTEVFREPAKPYPGDEYYDED
jgi:flagellar assembly factor FliW